MSSSYRMELDKWLSQLDVKADRVLDIGGAQEQMPPRVKSWDVKEYLIADLPEPHKDSPKPDMELDLNESPIFSDESTYGGEETFTYVRFGNNIARTKDFDTIFCLEVFDYVWNPANALMIISELLKDGGTAWVSFPFVYPTHNPIEDDMLRYTEFAVRKLAEVSGLTIKQIIPRRPETNAIENLWRAERMRAAKHYDHNVTGWIVEFTK